MRTLRLPRILRFIPLALAPLVTAGCSSGGQVTPGPDAGPDAGPTSSSTLHETAISTVAGCTDEHEPTIAVAPTGHVAVAFDAYCDNRQQIITGYRISSDFGVTWGDATLLPLPSGDNEEGNSSVAADAQGKLYIAWATEEHTATTRTNVHVYAAMAGPEDAQFGAPVAVWNAPAGSFVDSPRIAVTASGKVNVTFASIGSDGSETLEDATSTDMEHWTVAPVVPSGKTGGVGNFSHICQAEGSSRIFLAFQSYDLATLANGAAAALSYSDDDGATWSAPIEVSLPENDEEYEMMYFMDCATSGADVWVLYTVSPGANLAASSGSNLLGEPPATRLRLAHSPDRGQSIDWREDVGDADALFLVPTLVGEGNGALDLSFVSGTTLEGPASLRWSRATDGRSFTPSAEVGGGLTLATDRTSSGWMGDYNGTAFQGGNTFLVYADNSSGASHVSFFRSPAAGETPGDAGVATDGGPVASFDAGAPPCLSTSTFTPVAWAPPTSFGQAACTPTQISAYAACATSATGDCSAFRAASANAACLACIETDVGAAQHGPIVTQQMDGGVAAIETNTGGCQAHFDGQSGPTSCGAQVNASNDCFDAACSTCSDFASPGADGPTESCFYASVLPGQICGGADVTTACSNEELTGSVASTCAGTLSALLGAWCGP